jgi:hypothetical protein
MTTLYPLARRNQPQWLEVSLFLMASYRQSIGRTADGAAKGPRNAGKGRDSGCAAGLRSIPDGNHGDNLRSVTEEARL